MAMNLPLKDMSLEEKLAAMELLWEDLARSPESLESPGWHKDILDERCERVAESKAQFADWETAKKDIRSKTS
ncbi:MAG: addiction module protein [Chloroflexota bacterium]